VTARRKRARRPAPPVDPALRPFLDALAELLVAQEERLAEARRAVRKIATDIKSPTRTTTTTSKGNDHEKESRRKK
jgi:hypothetical protein